MKRVLVFNGYYIPAKKYGGPTTSMVTIVNNCSSEFDFYIIAANHDLNETTVFPNIQAGWNEVGKAKVLYLNPSEIAYSIKRVKEIVEDVRPDLVWLVGILVPASKWNVSYVCKKKKIPVLVSPRGEVCENTFHKKVLKKTIVACVARLICVYGKAYFHATSDEEICGLIKYFGVPKERIRLVPNISASLNAKPRVIEKSDDSIRIVFISRIMDKKNVLLAIQAVNKMTSSVQFDIYGPIESEEYWMKCKKEIEKSPTNVSISYCGALKPEEVAITFAKYHCFLFPTVSENYGHAIAEALSVSCPVVLSAHTTPWDDLDSKAGYICDLDDVDQFTCKLSQIASMAQKEYDTLILHTLEYFNDKVDEEDAVNKHISMLNWAIDNGL